MATAESRHRSERSWVWVCVGVCTALLIPVMAFVAWWWPTWTDRRAAALLEKLPGVVFFRREEGWQPKIPFVPERPDLEWIHSLRPPERTRTTIRIDHRFPKNKLRTMSGLAQLDWVSVEGLPLERRDVEMLSRLPGLLTLDLFNGTVDDKALAGFSGAGVVSMSLRDSEVSDTGVESLQICDSMRILNLSGTRVRKPALDRMGWNGDTLNVLKLARTEIGDDALDAVVLIPCLCFLDIRETRVTDAGLAKLAKAKELVALKASDKVVGDTGVKAVLSGRPPDHNWPRLEFDRTRVTSSGLMSLDIKVAQLSLAGTDCGNELVPWLVARTDLTELDLSGTRLDDEGLKGLEACPKLSLLRVANCRVTEADAIEFLVSSRTSPAYGHDGSTAKAAFPFVPGVGEILPDGAIRRSASGLGIYPPWIAEALWKFHGTGALYRPLEPIPKGSE
jgi:hypothetical protein